MCALSISFKYTNIHEHAYQQGTKSMLNILLNIDQGHRQKGKFQSDNLATGITIDLLCNLACDLCHFTCMSYYFNRSC